MKYELTKNTKVIDDVTLYQTRAVKDFSKVAEKHKLNTDVLEK